MTKLGRLVKEKKIKSLEHIYLRKDQHAVHTRVRISNLLA